VQHQIRRRRGQILGILELAYRRAMIRHAAGRIDEQMGVEIGFFLMFLDVVAIGLAEGAPVDVANFVAGVILLMLGEFDAESLVGAFVYAAEEIGRASCRE